jgi:hypothetical protein
MLQYIRVLRSRKKENMKERNFSINLVYFANVWQLFRGFILGWDFVVIGKNLKKSGISLMMLPMRGTRKGSFPSYLVREWEGAWNYSSFSNGIGRILKGVLLLPQVLLKGSTTDQKFSVFQALDKLAGLNAEGSGTLIDWLLFGSPEEAKAGEAKLSEDFPSAFRTSHGLLSDNPGYVREIHPEMREEYFRIKNAITTGGSYKVWWGLESELDLIKNSTDFLDYLYKSNLSFCVDTFHTFMRGARDGSNLEPVVSGDRRDEFLVNMASKTKVVHFRLDKRQVKEILYGRARSMGIFLVMKYMFQNYESEFVYEIYPDLLTTTKSKVGKIRMLHKKLVRAFNSK